MAWIFRKKRHLAPLACSAMLLSASSLMRAEAADLPLPQQSPFPLATAGGPLATVPGDAILLAQASSPSQPTRPDGAAQGRSPAAQRGPGTFEVDEAAAQRALERTLTQTGALLLPARTFELTPSFSYARLEQTSAFLATAPGLPSPVLANTRTRTNDLSANLQLRAGLPLDSQLELGLPFRHVRTSQVDDFGNATSDNASGLGDITIGAAKTFVRERGAVPDLVGRLTYNTGSGKRQSGLVNFNAGFRQVSAEVVALKRQDPLAFTLSASYNKVFEKDSIKPGDAAIVTAGAALAASPATSLQFAFSQVYRQKLEINGVKTPGSDQTYGIVSLGASSVLSRDVTLVTQFGIGLGSDAPKYSFVIALPILFR